MAREGGERRMGVPIQGDTKSTIVNNSNEEKMEHSGRSPCCCRKNFVMFAKQKRTHIRNGKKIRSLKKSTDG